MVDNKNINFKNRIYELDILKGIGMLGVIANHACFYIYLLSDNNLKYLNFSNDSNIGKWILHFAKWFVFSENLVIPQFIFRAIFIITVGISFSLSRNNLKRGIKLLFNAMIVSLYGIFIYFVIKDTFGFIFHGILHAMTISIFLSYPLYRHIKNKYFYLFSSIIIGKIGYYYFENSTWIRYESIPIHKLIIGEFIGYYRSVSSDTFPGLIVWSGIMFGIFIGKQFYKEKKSVFGLEYKDNFISKIGRNSLFYYMFSRTLLPSIELLIIFLFTIFNR